MVGLVGSRISFCLFCGLSAIFLFCARSVLRSAVDMLIDDCRDVLRVNAEVKEIERSIRKQRLAELRSA